MPASQCGPILGLPQPTVLMALTAAISSLQIVRGPFKNNQRIMPLQRPPEAADPGRVVRTGMHSGRSSTLRIPMTLVVKACTEHSY
ncbi:hypothetical protein PM082_000130 [Marasmius tenuissimus]|nr:hypothetical protein PM082_000606 [Marasmius tenuissimus]KAJ8077930.1 hypothetical protein PM082_000130 [Marasmius tenuissimus]